MRSRHGHLRGSKPERTTNLHDAPELTSQAGKKPIMVNQVDIAPRLQCRLGYFSAGLTAHTEKKPMRANLLNAAPFWGNLLGNLRGGILPRRRAANQARRNRWATMPLRQSRLCFRYAGLALSKGKNQHRRGDCAAGVFRQRRNFVVPRRTYPCRRARSGVREPIKRSRRYCGVAMATFEETTRGARQICTVR